MLRETEGIVVRLPQNKTISMYQHRSAVTEELYWRVRIWQRPSGGLATRDIRDCAEACRIFFKAVRRVLYEKTPHFDPSPHHLREYAWETYPTEKTT